MIKNFLTLSFCVSDFFRYRLSYIAAYIYDINRVGQIDFFVVCVCQERELVTAECFPVEIVNGLQTQNPFFVSSSEAIFIISFVNRILPQIVTVFIIIF